MIKAEYIRNLTGFRGTATLWRIDDHYVVTSALRVLWSSDDLQEFRDEAGEDSELVQHLSETNVSETLVFWANADGEVLSWANLPGSFRGAADHERAVEGYVEHLNAQAAARRALDPKSPN